MIFLAIVLLTQWIHPLVCFCFWFSKKNLQSTTTKNSKKMWLSKIAQIERSTSALLRRLIVHSPTEGFGATERQIVVQYKTNFWTVRIFILLICWTKFIYRARRALALCENIYIINLLNLNWFIGCKRNCFSIEKKV